MAKGRRAWLNRLMLLLAMVLYAVLLAAEIAPNPFPGIWEWLSRDRPLAADLAWQHRLGSRPDAAAVAGDAVAVAAGGSTQLRDRASGEPVGPAQAETWDADWLVVAGAGDEAVVITKPDGGDGYQVRSPTTGRVLHEEPDGVVAAWGFRDAWLDLRCDDRRACQLRAFRPGSVVGGAGGGAGGGQAAGPVAPVWTADLPGQRSGLLGAHPDLAGPREPEPSRIHPRAAGPAPLPPLLGVPMARDGAEVVAVVDTAGGRVLRVLEPRDGERIIVAGDRVVSSVMAEHNGICVSEVTGYDATTGEPVWGPAPHHLWGTDGVGCQQRTPPLGGGGALAALGPDGRPLVIDAYDGRVLWTGERDERVEDLSADRAVVRTGDGGNRYGVLLGGDGQRLWERPADPDAGVLLADCGVVVADRDPNRVYVWDPDTGEDRLSVATSARVLACAPDGVLIADGRSIGFARFPDAAPESSPDQPGTRGSEAPLTAK